MTADALGTYAATLLLLACSAGIGSGVLAVAGARRFTPIAVPVGLAGATVLGWWAVRLPGEGVTAAIALLALGLAGFVLAAIRLDDLRAGLVALIPPAAVALVVVSIPFIADGHFGVLGTGFNVDMSQHLFAANWLADPSGLSPSLIRNGYPLGPHALAVAANEITGELTLAFTAVTIAVPVTMAIAAGAVVEGLARWRSLLIAALTAFAYLSASYIAQGAFKELFEATFLLAFALWLREIGRDRSRTGGGAAMLLPGAVMAAGALYVYSWPGLAWLGGAAALWALAGLARSSKRGASTRASVVPALVGVLLLVAMAAPEIDRISKFGTSVDAVTERTPGTSGTGAQDPDSSKPAGGDPDASRERPEYDNSLGNLFGQINPASVFGIWPSGDFRVEPGAGAVPAPVFYLGAALGALALALGVTAAWRRSETALLAALAAAAAIWLAARVGSTPYTSAKALQMLAPVVMLIAAVGLLDPLAPSPIRGRSRRGFAAIAAAFVAGTVLSSVLALGNAPVGPDDYTPGVRKLANRFAGQPTLLLAPPEVISDERGEEFYGWELRGAGEAEVRPLKLGEADPAPPGFSRVIVVGGSQAPPFANLKRIGSSNRAVLWQVMEIRPGA